MNPFSMKVVTQFADLLTTALVHFVWQGAALAMILLVTVKLLDVRTARLRYLFSVGTLLMMGITPVVTAKIHYQGPSQPHYSVESSGQSIAIVEDDDAINAVMPTGRIDADLSNRSATPWDPRIEIWVLTVWLAGVLILSIRLAIGFGVTLWIRAHVKPLTEEFEQRVRILGDRLSVNARQRVFASLRVGQAVAVGFIRPVVLIPAAWLTQLTPETLEAIIAHELAHIRRWDLWVNLVQRIIEMLLFYHPAVWWLSSRIRLEREMCCDEIAAGCFDRATYVRSLESVATMAEENLLLATSINSGKRMHLLNRIRYLLGAAPTDTAGNWWAVVFVSVILLFAVIVAFSRFAVTAPGVVRADNARVIENIEPREHQDAKSDRIMATSVQAKTITLTQQYTGRIQAQRHIEIRAAATGHIDAIPIKEGQKVKEGDLLFTVRPVLYQAKLDAANAETKLAQLEFNYTKKHFEDKVVSMNEVLLQEAKLDKAKARSQQAAAEFDLTIAKAPFEGIVDRLHHQLGSLVLEGEVLTTLSDNSALRVYFDVPETRYLEYMLDPQQHREVPTIELILSNGSKFQHTGKINAIEADFNKETGTISFRADFPNPDRLLRHGQSGIVLFQKVLNDAITIPQQATFEVHNGRYAFVVDEDNVAHQREIVIQAELEDLFVIKGGLAAGDRIIVEGIKQVHDGEKVNFNIREK